MQALRLNEVLTRVVAWHNRHPLARRINASQVHSIGEVILPFASAQALPSPPAAPAAPAMHELLDPPAAALGELPASADSDPLAAQPTEPAEPAPADPLTGTETETGPDAETAALADPPDAGVQAPAEPAPVLSMQDEADDLFSQDPPPASEQAATDDDGPEMLVELTSDPDEPAPAPADGPVPTAEEPATDPEPDLSVSEADSAELAAAFAAATDDVPAPPEAAAQGPTADQEAPVDPPPDPGSGQTDGAPADPLAQPAEPAPATDAAPEGPIDALAPPASLRQASAANTVPVGWLARLRAALTGWRPGGAGGLPRLQATFSRDFIWPLRPGQVARWARRHGSRAPTAPADWPQREIDSDASLLAQARRQGLMHPLPLHVLTAAIGVGDRRIRVLIDAQGRVLGPRAYSPPKLAALASVAALGLLGAGWGWLPRADSLSAKQTSAIVAVAASAAAQAASAADLAAAAASAAERVWRAQQAEFVLAGAPPADAPPEAPPADAGHAAAPANPQPAMPAPHGGEAAASAPEPAPTPAPVPATDPGTAPPPRKPIVPLGTFVAVLSDADKLAARQQVEAARNGQIAALAAQPPKQAAPVFAIVTQATREKASAARGLALMRASGQRLSGELPERGELMLSQGEWRAAWWPFESQADAERARVMLAARGLKVEVVEF